MSTERHDDEPPMLEGTERVPRGAKMMAIVRWFLVVAAAAIAGFMWLSYAKERHSSAETGAREAKPKYHCPMHPQVVSDEPGECPICHMQLEPIPAAPEEIDAGAHAASIDDGGSASPRAASRIPATTGERPGNIPAGTAPVKLTLDRIQSIGVRTAVAEERSVDGALRVTAAIAPPEQGTSEVHVRTPGFVEAIQVDQTGVAVGAGQAMLSVYSPEILQAENELLAVAAWSTDAGGPAAMTSAARRKLELLGMPASDIEQVVARREPRRAISVVCPRGGFVTKKNVVLGSYVTPEMVLYEVQDLSSVYVVADVLLADSTALRPGVEGTFTPTGHPGDAAAVKVDLVYPVINAEARTRRARMPLRNPNGRKYTPGEYGVVELALGARSGVAIPRDAVIETGTARYVFVVEDGGRFVPRIVAVSGGDRDRIMVAEGLSAGERVVSGATFLIDSESRLQASMSQSGAMP